MVILARTTLRYPASALRYHIKLNVSQCAAKKHARLKSRGKEKKKVCQVKTVKVLCISKPRYEGALLRDPAASAALCGRINVFYDTPATSSTNPQLCRALCLLFREIGAFMSINKSG